MPSDLVANPYLQFKPFTDADPELVLIAPKSGEGLIELSISRSEYPNLFDVFTDLFQTHLSFLNADEDLDETERELLLLNGVLVRKDAKPEKPFFACHLCDVPIFMGDLDRERLIANPGFDFEELDLSGFALMSQKYHLSPFNSLAWITDPVAEMRRGYWLDPAEAEIIYEFDPGKPVDSNIPDILIRKLIAAGILGTNESFVKNTALWEEKLKDANKKFGVDKYAVVDKIFPPEQMNAMRRYYRQYVAEGFMPFGDNQVKRRFRQHNEPFASFLHGKLLKLVEIVVGESLKLSYVFAASYKEGAELTPHTDREQCEFSISFQVDYQPEHASHLSPWALYLEPLPKGIKVSNNPIHFTSKEIERDRQAPCTPVYLASGDALIYKGRELIHYRKTLPAGHRSTSLFFHFVRADFSGSLL